MVEQIRAAARRAVMLGHVDAPAVEHKAISAVKADALYDVARGDLTADRAG